MNDKYVLPQAAQDTLGGIKAAKVQDKYTQECRIDKETGKLYTRSAENFGITDIIEGKPAITNCSAEKRMIEVEGYGESFQNTTLGNQLCDFIGKDKTGVSVKGFSISVDTPQIILNNPGKTLYIHAEVSGLKEETTILISMPGVMSATPITLLPFGQTDYQIILPPQDIIMAYQEITFSGNTDGTEVTYNNLYMGFEPYAGYEPYTGGAPSPSPEYPQEIKSSVVTGGKVTGKNLFDPKKLSGGEFVEFKGAHCYKYKDDNKNFTFDLSENKIESLYLTIMMYRDSEYADKRINVFFEYNDGTRQSSNALTSGVIYTIESKEGKILKKIVGNDNWSQNVYIDLSITQLECGTTATPYEPYKEKTIPLSAPIALRGIPSESGNVTIDGQKYLSDYIGQKEGVYGVFRKTQKKILNGSEFWQKIASIKVFVANFVFGRVFNQADGICNQLIINGDTSPKAWIGSNNANFYAVDTSFFDDNLPDCGLANWKAHLAENPLKIITIADEETFEPLPEADQQALKELKTFYPTSIISWETEDGTGAWTRAEIKCDLKSYILEKIQEIKNNSITQIQNINSNFIR